MPTFNALPAKPTALKHVKAVYTLLPQTSAWPEVYQRPESIPQAALAASYKGFSALLHRKCPNAQLRSTTFAVKTKTAQLVYCVLSVQPGSLKH